MTVNNKWRDLGDVGTVGLEFILWLALGYYVGHWLDHRYFHDHGYATASGALFGVVGAFKAIYEAAKRAQRRLEAAEKSEQSKKEPDK